MRALIIRSMRRNSSWCLTSSSLNRTSARAPLIAEPVLAGLRQHLGTDESLDEPEDQGARAPDLAEEPAVRLVQERELTSTGRAAGTSATTGRAADDVHVMSQRPTP
jgi:hypothetical protein